MRVPRQVKALMQRFPTYALRNLLANIEREKVDRYSLAYGIDAAILTTPEVDEHVRLQVGSASFREDRFKELSVWLDHGMEGSWPDRLKAIERAAREILNGREAAEVEAIVPQHDAGPRAYGSPF